MKQIKEGKQSHVLKTSLIETPLGTMIAIADEKALFFLEFADHKATEREVERLGKKMQSAITPGNNAILHSITHELERYFEGKLKTFKTPLQCTGSPFQKNVWDALQKIPYGQTYAYADIAKAIHYPSAFRAVARANATNKIAIIIPCHRVINSNGNIGGYAGGVARKEWLLTHEKKYLNSLHP